MKKYPAGTVRKLLATDAVTAPTRAALEKRLHEAENYQPRFFSQAEFALLEAICRCLIPQTEVDCAAFIDKNFSDGKSDGWRYDKLPEDAETWRGGIVGIDETARSKFSTAFVDLSDARKDEILSEIQSGEAAGETWKTLNSKLFFEELVARAAEVYYSHPIAQERIGYVGMADAPGWTRINLNELEAREPRAMD